MSSEKPKVQASGRPRFYKIVSVAEVNSPPPGGEGLGVGGPPTSNVLQSPPPCPSPTRGEGTTNARAFRLLLDGKPVRTPAKKDLLLPTRALAEAVAAEWDAQTERIDPTTMPLTRLANSAIDGVTGREAEVRADIVKYAGSDLVCYRAEGPEALVARQADAWNPILEWAATDLGVRLILAQGVMPVVQPQAALARIAEAVQPLSPFQLAGLHVATTLTGSAVLALAILRGRLMPQEAWATAHVDEDYQIELWGADAEAESRRRKRWQDMQAASRLLMLL